MRSHLCWIAIGFIACLTPTSATAATITLNAIDSGNYDNVFGLHSPTRENYGAGLCIPGDCAAGDVGAELRNFFAFDLSGITEQIVGARLILNTETVYDTGTFTLWDVTTDVDALRAGGSGLFSVWDDLGSGTLFGSKVIGATQDNTLLSVALNLSAINALNTATGSLFAIGGDYDGLFGAFFFSGSFDTRQLVLETVPEPSSVTLFAFGGVLLFLCPTVCRFVTRIAPIRISR